MEGRGRRPVALLPLLLVTVVRLDTVLLQSMPSNTTEILSEPALMATEATVGLVPTRRSENLSHLPSTHLQLLRSREVQLPAVAYSFDDITTGTQRYPEGIRYLSFPDTTPCHCRHRCLVDVRCMGFEHHVTTGDCSLTDVLLPDAGGRVPAGGWSTSRRRGVSWLGAPCRDDADCTLLVSGAVCGMEDSCVCPEGWSAVTELLCRPDGRWVEKLATAVEGWPLIGATSEPSLQRCKEACRHTVNCMAVEFETETSLCRLYAVSEPDTTANAPDTEAGLLGTENLSGSATGTETVSATDESSGENTSNGKGTSKNTTGTSTGHRNTTGTSSETGTTTTTTGGEPPSTGVVTYVWELPTPPAPPPEGYTAISGRFLRLTRAVFSVYAAASCLNVGGVHHSPGSRQMVDDILEALETGQLAGSYGTDISYPGVGVGVHEMLEEGLYVTVTGTAIGSDSPLWAAGEPSGAEGQRECCFYNRTSGGLDDMSCRTRVPQLCEHIGEHLLVDLLPGTEIHDYGDMSWRVYDFNAERTFHRLLYVASGDILSPLEFTEIRVGSHPFDRSDVLSALCFRERGPLVDRWFSRILRCPEPLVGRYLHVGQMPGDIARWYHIAVFDN
ncbi:hypothetical protein FJT64_009571 [Amphibalanus amphitrite]|uniref:Apple domain-containing protein n=1 Tax=Amphibalanus amphitrite TaxID=1232801 RepID=A0A6A4VD50_AMPAM|nr:hypothetical protein FJT64_009571 [Amphibalanus amphitrite]